MCNNVTSDIKFVIFCLPTTCDCFLPVCAACDSFLCLGLRIAKSSEQLKVGVHERATSEFCCVECGPQDVGGLTVHSFCKRMVLLNDRTSVIAKNYMAILSFEYRSKPTYVP